MLDAQEDTEVYLPSKQLEKDHVLMPDLSAYDMLHSMSVQWPFLSFDVIKDQLGDERRNVPHPHFRSNHSILRQCTLSQELKPINLRTTKSKS